MESESRPKQLAEASVHGPDPLLIALARLPRG